VRSSGCGVRFRATSTAEVQVCGMVCGGTTVELSRMGCCDCALGVPSGDRVARGWNALGESLCWHHASRDDGDALGLVFPAGGVILELQPCYMRLSE